MAGDEKRVTPNPYVAMSHGSLITIIGGLAFIGFGVLPAVLIDDIRNSIPPIVNSAWNADYDSPDFRTYAPVAALLLFALAGAQLLLRGLLALPASIRAWNASRRWPDEPWRWDFPWATIGTSDTSVRRGDLLRTLLGAAIWLPPLNVPPVIWQSPMAFMVAMIDLIFALCIIGQMFVWIRRTKYGQAHIKFASFPFHAGESVKLAISNSTVVDQLRSLKATLRLVEARTIRSGSSRGGSNTIYVETFAYTQQVLTGQQYWSGQPLEIVFNVPDSVQGNAIGPQGRYWELEVEGDTPGIDYGAKFLVPLYSASKS